MSPHEQCLGVRREYFYRFTPVKLKKREEKMGGEPVRYAAFITGNAAGSHTAPKVRGQCPLVVMVKVVWISSKALGSGLFWGYYAAEE